MKFFLNIAGNFTLRTKLVITYIFLITMPIFFISLKYYTASTEVISDAVKENALEIVKKNNEIIDVKLSFIKDNMFSFITDKDFVNTFGEVNPHDDYSLLLLDDKISVYLNKYFLQNQDIYSAQLATSYFVFGPRSTSRSTFKSLIPRENYVKSQIYQKAKTENSGMQWIPTYDFGQMFNIQYLENIDVDYKYMFAAIVGINDSFYANSDFSFSEGIEKPTLILNFKEDFFHEIYEDSIPVEGSSFFVIDKEGYIISHQNRSLLTKKITSEWLQKVISSESGTDLIEIEGKKMIICYSMSSVTGWISAVVFPPDKLIEPMIPGIRAYTIYLSAVLAFISTILAYILSYKITNPISKLAKAIKKTGKGRFDLKMKEEGSLESRELIRRFNIMNEEIQKLIIENYEIKIKEKEAEINALNLQLDPHFMYNTLNLINLISIENGQDEISEMIISLSQMLKYTVKNRDSLVPFKLDMQYLKSYIYIMTKRFEGKFDVLYDIDPELDNYYVPKFFLQPFVENAIIHAFDFDKKGLLKITCRIQDGMGIHYIEDNGKGISPERIREIFNPERGAVGINNVDKRIKAIFGNEYGVFIESVLDKGTKITITHPLKSNNM